MAEAGWPCPLCNVVLPLSCRVNHSKNLWKDIDNPTRCDNIARHTAVPLLSSTTLTDDDAPVVTEGIPVITAPVEEETDIPFITAPVDEETDIPFITVPVDDTDNPVITAPASVGLSDVARRPERDTELCRKERSTYTIIATENVLSHQVRDVCKLQDIWGECKACVRKQFCPSFWSFFLPIHHLPSNGIDSALRAAKSTFLTRGTATFQSFPPSKRAMMAKINTVAVQFWKLVSHAVDIDLSHFNLPSGTKSVKFRFIDPVWGWLVAARRLDPLDLHWKSVEQQAQNVYGGGVQFGKAFRQACDTCPLGGYPMLFSLHWDGTGAHGLNTAPICVGVANYNGGSASAHYCLGYIPATPDSKSLTDSTIVKHYIRQRCAENVLSVMEASAVSGIMCRLRNQHGIEVPRLLFPRLMSMNFDQPEAQLCFGLQNKTSCSKCKWRQGYSAFRKASPQSGSAVRLLYKQAADKSRPEVAKKAQSKLHKWGFNYKRVSCLFSFRDILIHIPGKDEVFPAVDFRDVMHGLKIFLHRVIVLKTINEIKCFSKEAERTLLSRLDAVFRMQTFRSRQGHSYRKKLQIFSADTMSAKDKVALLFILPHLIGHRADIVPPALREPLLTALAHAQLLLIASSGLRSFTEHELHVIFDRGTVQLFGALQSLHCTEYDRRLALHQQDPEKKSAPKLPKLQQRCAPDVDDTDTDSTDDESFAGRGIFSHGGTALAHQHWVDQIVSAGCFSIHNTEAAEAYHKHCMRLASSRVRHLNDLRTTHSMLKYLFLHDLFTELKEASVRKKLRKAKVNFSYGVRVPLIHNGNVVRMKQPPTPRSSAILTSPGLQKSFFHSELLLARYELLDLVCDFLGVPRTRESYGNLECLTWDFGQKLIRKDGKVFWATDSQYTYAYNADAGQGRRRDILLLKGTEQLKHKNALCCEAVAFFTLGRIHLLPFPTPPRVRQAIDADTDEITFVIGRWFEPHPDARSRDNLYRPICPGPLSINHCLWTYASTSTARQSLSKSNGEPCAIYKEQKQLFGQTVTEQTKRWALDRHAWFGIFTPDRIVQTENMCPAFVQGSTSIDYGTWLHTVIMI